MSAPTRKPVGAPEVSFSLQVAGVLPLEEESIFALPPLSLVVRPDRHECPICHRRVTHAATLCGFCWTKGGPGHDRPDERAVDERLARALS